MPAGDPTGEIWPLIRSAYRTALKRLNARLAKEGITFSQYSVLLAIARHGPMQMSKLSEHMLVAPANVTGLVDRLQKKGYVRRAKRSADRRLFVIEMTEAGGLIHRRVSGRFAAYVRSIEDDLTRDEVSATIGYLRRILARIEGTKEI